MLRKTIQPEHVYPLALEKVNDYKKVIAIATVMVKDERLADPKPSSPIARSAAGAATSDGRSRDVAIASIQGVIVVVDVCTDAGYVVRDTRLLFETATID